jgi:hypothetical protein
MAKKPTITTVTTGFQSGATMNANFEALRDGFDNTLSLDGSTPNAMNANLDMNGNNILNAGTVAASSITVDGQEFIPESAVTVTVPDWEGVWATSTVYAVNDLVRQDGNVYICLVAHTSGTFSTDLAASRWELFASKGDSGAGSGDMIAANNLSDLVDADTALANLGGGTVGIAIFKDTTAANVRAELDLEVGTDVQAYNANLASLAGLTLQQGDLLYVTGADTLVRLPKGTAGQTLVMNSGATAPEWVTATSSGLGVGQTWQTPSRAASTAYQNTTGKPIFVSVSGGWNGVDATPFEVSNNGVTWINANNIHSGGTNYAAAIIPNNGYYRWNGGTITTWVELR